MVTFRVPDMTCGHCASTISRAVASVDKGARINIRIQEKLVWVTRTATGAELVEAIKDAGYTAQEVAEPAQSAQALSSAGCCCGSRKAA